MSSRPESIVRFECLGVLSVVGEVISLDRQGFGVDLLGDLLWPAVMLWLIVRIARGQSAIARTIYSALWTLPLLVALAVYAGVTGDLIKIKGEFDALHALVSLVAVAQLITLWTPSSSEWLTERLRSARAS